MSRQFARLIAASVSVAALALGGCSSHRQLATQAVSFNLAVEKAQNEMLLLNVIRAKDRLPMYMTGISSLSGNVQTTLTTSLGGSYSRTRGHVPAGLDTLARGLTPSATGTLSTNPNFTLAVLDTQEFMRGFLSPIGKDTLAYYWNQGWPQELLLNLLVQRVVIEAKDRPPLVFDNHPDSDDPNLGNVKSFGCWLRDFLARDPQIEEVQVIEDLGPQLSRGEVNDVAKLVQIAKEGMLIRKVNPDKEVYQLQRQRTDLRFKLRPRSGNAGRGPECDAALSSYLPETPAAEPKSDQTSQQRQQYDQSLQDKGKVGVTLAGSTTITFVLRSPEALMYYLGELMRVANRQASPKMPYVCIQGRFQPVFVALPTGRCEDGLLEADSGRGRYSVPPASLPGFGGASAPCEKGELRIEDAQCEGGRSMQALRLVSQIMSLQKSAKDLPSTATVRLID